MCFARHVAASVAEALANNSSSNGLTAGLGLGRVQKQEFGVSSLYYMQLDVHMSFESLRMLGLCSTDA